MVKPKKKLSAFKSIKKSEFRKTPPSMYEIGKGAVAPQDMKRVVDKGSERGSKFMSFLKSAPKRILESIVSPFDVDTDLRVGPDLNDYYDRRRNELEEKNNTKDLNKEEQQFLDKEYAREERIEKRKKNK